MHSASICAIVVLYFPDGEILERLRRIKKQVDAVVVVDNSGTEVGRLPAELGEHRFHLIRNESNLGVATALNQGTQWASQQDFKWVILFDQDTEPMEGMSRVLLAVYQEYCKNGRKMLLGANYINGLGNVQFTCQDTSEQWMTQKTIITSGTLLSLELYRFLGPFRDDFFIDAVDYDYSLKARAKGVDVIVTCDPLMVHTIGSQTRHNLFLKKTAVSNHNAVRRYYMARNYMTLVLEYWAKEPVWVLKRLIYLVKTIVLISFFEEKKLSKLAALISGMWHGVTGKIGYVQP